MNLSPRKLQAGPVRDVEEVPGRGGHHAAARHGAHRVPLRPGRARQVDGKLAPRRRPLHRERNHAQPLQQVNKTGSLVRVMTH